MLLLVFTALFIRAVAFPAAAFAELAAGAQVRAAANPACGYGNFGNFEKSGWRFSM